MPENSLLDNINSPADVKKLSVEQLPQLAAEIRREIIGTVAQTGGHLASNLGAIELTIALHYCLDTPKDKIIWDVGHQSYTHKILTGRRQRMSTLRQWQGLSGFPHRGESVYDTFTVGHGSTSISTALGLSCACADGPEKPKIAVVIGDASLGGGMAFEALNHAGQLGKDILVVLNDNKMAISKSVGALSHYLNRILTMPVYNRVRQDWENLLQKIAPRLGKRLTVVARRLEEGLKSLLVPGMIFEELGFRYFGPIDGHNAAELIRTLKNVLQLKGPVLIHAITKKGKGDPNAEKVPEKFHGVGSLKAQGIPQTKSWTEVFSGRLIDLAGRDKRVVAVTAAMLEGTGLDEFARHFPRRCYDVGMAEAHAVGFAAGLAYAGLRPFVAIYSTFLQRSYDQIIHDVCLQNLPVTFILDRAGIVGEDGATHQGIFDLAYLRHIPNLSVLAPKDGRELEQMLEFALTTDFPLAIRYPKGSAPVNEEIFPEGYNSPQIEQGRAEFLRAGNGQAAIVALGSMVYPSMQAAGMLRKQDINCAVVNARFAVPVDDGIIKRLCAEYKTLILVEEGVSDGGFGSAVLEFLEQEKIAGVRVRRMALPSAFIPHGRREFLLEKYGLTAAGIAGVAAEECAGL